MLGSKLREILVNQMRMGRRPQVVLMGLQDWTELVQDITGKRDAFDPVIFQGVVVVTDDQILTVASQIQATEPSTTAPPAAAS